MKPEEAIPQSPQEEVVRKKNPLQLEELSCRPLPEIEHTLLKALETFSDYENALSVKEMRNSIAIGILYYSLNFLDKFLYREHRKSSTRLGRSHAQNRIKYESSISIFDNTTHPHLKKLKMINTGTLLTKYTKYIKKREKRLKESAKNCLSFTLFKLQKFEMLDYPDNEVGLKPLFLGSLADTLFCFDCPEGASRETYSLSQSKLVKATIIDLVTSLHTKKKTEFNAIFKELESDERPDVNFSKQYLDTKLALQKIVASSREERQINRGFTDKKIGQISQKKLPQHLTEATAEWYHLDPNNTIELNSCAIVEHGIRENMEKFLDAELKKPIHPCSSLMLKKKLQIFIEGIISCIFLKITCIVLDEAEFCIESLSRITQNGEIEFPSEVTVFDESTHPYMNCLTPLRIDFLLDNYAQHAEEKKAGLSGALKKCFYRVMSRIRGLEKTDESKHSPVFVHCAIDRLFYIDNPHGIPRGYYTATDSKLVKALIIDLIERLYAKNAKQFDLLIAQEVPKSKESKIIRLTDYISEKEPIHWIKRRNL